jgi:short-subunit dehydrogenase
VALVGRQQKNLEEVVGEILRDGGVASSFTFDLARVSAIPHLVEQIEERFASSVDVLVNNAAWGVAGLVEDLPIEHYRRSFEVNLFAPIGLIQAVLPGMKQKRSGQIIMVTSGVGKRALPGFSAYCATKFALNGLTESLRIEVKPFGIDVISFSPGPVATRFHERIATFGQIKLQFPKIRQMRTAEEVAQKIFEASKKRKRELTLPGQGKLGYHLNYWAPSVLDWIISRSYRVRLL